jgi:ribosomal protein S18 acetylase RimI-like enzyme
VTVQILSAAGFSHEVLAETFTAGYEDYFTPLALDARLFGLLARIWDYDLESSRVALGDDGARIGLAMLGRRGEEGWVGGVGVVPNHRGEGLGRRLMEALADEARARGVKRLWLEVLVQNEPAIRLYEKLGYEHVRELEVWQLERHERERHDVTQIPVETALGRTRDRLPWQRADATVVNLGDAKAFENPRGTLIYRPSTDATVVLQVAAASEDAARELLAALPPETTAVRYLNGPTGDPVNEALGVLGATQTERQHEMLLEL